MGQSDCLHCRDSLESRKQSNPACALDCICASGCYHRLDWGILTLSRSSQALPAPKPRPVHTGHARRLNRSTEKMTPKDAPRVLRMRRVLRQWSHFSFNKASLMGRLVRTAGAATGVLEEVESAMMLR